MPDIRILTLRNATGTVRREMHDGREYVVVPVVALVEGVIHAVNSPQPELVRAAEFAACADWEGMPVHAGHPMRDGQPISGRLPETLALAIGTVRNPSADAQRLLMEAWLNPSRCLEGPAQRILARVTAVPPQMVEVSVGVFVNAEKSHGVWRNGKRYEAEWRGMRKDHLALLDDGKTGACSVEMGCGTPRIAMRVAESGELEMDEPTLTLKERFTKFLRTLMPRNWGDDEVKQELREALLEKEPSFKNGEIVRVKNDAVIYCLYPPPPMYYDAPSSPYDQMTYWTRDYTFDTSTQKFTISDNRTQVEPTTHYEPMRVGDASIVPDVPEPTPTPCACGNHAARAAGDSVMTKAERLAALVANPHSVVKSLKMLEAATDDELTALEAMAGQIKAASDKAAEEKVAADKKAADDKAAADKKAADDAAAQNVPKPRTAEDWLAEAPAELREEFVAMQAAKAAKKTSLITSIRAASQVFTEDQLKAKSIDELTQLATFVKVDPKVDYSGLGTPRVAATTDDSTFAPPDAYASLRAKAATH